MKEYLKTYWWVAPLLVFNILYYFFIRHTIERQQDGILEGFQPEAILFTFLISLGSIACVRLVVWLAKRRIKITTPTRYLITLLLSTFMFIVLIPGTFYSIEIAMGKTISQEYLINNFIILLFLHIIIGNAAIAVTYFRSLYTYLKNY